jgi:regulatory protein
VNRGESELELTAWDEDAQAGTITVHTSDGATYEVAPSAQELQGLSVGRRLTSDELDGLRFAATRKSVAKAALKLLDRRFYSSARLRSRLFQKDFPAEAVDAVLDQLAEQGLLDDRRFAESWCRDQLARRPVGPRWLRSGLHDQGVAPEAIDFVLDALFPQGREKEACAEALASRHYSLDDDRGKARAIRFLNSRGFSPSLAREIVFEASHSSRAREEDA